MADLQDQIDWEQLCIERGSARYYANQDRLREKGQGDTTDVMSHLIKDRLEECGEFLEETMKGGRGIHSTYNAVIRKVADGDYIKLAYIALKSALKAVQVKDKNTILKVALDIANRIEADLKCTMFEAAHPAYYDTVKKSFKTQNVLDYTHQHKVMMKLFGDFELEWHDWTSINKTHIGTRILRGLLHVFSDVMYMKQTYNRGKRLLVLETTEEFDAWSKEFERERGLMHPMYLPLKIPARPWSTLRDGGYHSPRMRLKFVKARGKDHNQFVADNLPYKHMQAINKLQRTAWEINADVLAVQEEIYEKGLGIGMPSNERITPPEFPTHLKDIEKEDLTESQQEEVKAWKMIAKQCYGREQQRKGKILAFMQGHRLAKELRGWEKLYYAYTCDFRGRVYCATTGLSPQGADTAKGLLRFHKGVELGESGVKWTAIHGANVYGVDKVGHKAQQQWVADHQTAIKAVVEDPIAARSFWGAADKPYQFLAFCYEWAACNYGKDTKYKGHLPIGLDGSCNGLQHYSAMLRDHVGATATNLVDAELPDDIYQQVADVTMKKLQKQLEKDPEDELAAKWLKVGVNRKCAKRPVMTLPYGATQQSARVYIMEYVMDTWANFDLPEDRQWEVAKYLTPILWGAIGEVVLAARVAMAWLKNNCTNGYVTWKTPIGFPVYQWYKKVDVKEVQTQLSGSVRLSVRDINNDGEPNKFQQKNGIAPNFVHSLDSTHMIMTINGTDLGSYAMIHDDFGTHAGRTQELYTAIRQAFVKLYSRHDPLLEWAEQVGVSTDRVPAKGSFEIKNVLDSKYFFS